MNFRRPQQEPEINLIPFIDVLLVILIFLMLSTTYSKFAELKITLPTANGEPQVDYPKEVVVTVGSEGNYGINGKAIQQQSVEALALAISEASAGNKEVVVVVNADALASHQAVMSVLDAARQEGLIKVTFAARNDGPSTKPK
jgi:biopolymer transport protein ExbD